MHSRAVWKVLGLLMLAGAAATAALPAPAQADAAPSGASTAEALFAASFKDFDRQLQPLAQYRGQPMLVYFWATWCKSCKHEVPELKALHEKYKDRKLKIVGVAVDNTDKVVQFAKDYQINYTLLLGSNDAIALSKKLGNSVGGLPFAVIVDAQGRLVHSLLGETPPGRFEELVRPLL